MRPEPLPIATSPTRRGDCDEAGSGPPTLGPGGLTAMQARFVIEYTSGEGAIGNASEAARRAGYSVRSAHEIGRQLLEKPHVREAIDKANRAQISGALAAKAVRILERIIDDEQASLKLRLEASKTVLDRAGIIAQARSAEDKQRWEKPISQMSIEELDEMIAATRRQLDFLEPEEALGAED